MVRHSINPTVTGVDNRGNTEHPFGYVYFSDGNRLMFGDTVSGVGPYGLNVSNWGALPRNPYFEIAETAIREHLSPKATTPDETPDDDDDDDDDECSDCGEYLEDHCEKCGECDCTCDDTDEECDACGCTENEYETDCDCDNASCPAQCYSCE